ncbi:AAA family ATPase [Ferruginivarius sediminum]|uniref:AAA family ATPase n=1 Tax=Ferruginivarius sediminum TaxID=2661937 RepID=A0A369TBE3_9PROT|nr:AAA family ATPase [Ferruginivarius sediminum]RDD62629.1 AAA family ATPase [Ferruginivarius sediminum]
MTGKVETFEPKCRFPLTAFDDIRLTSERDYLLKGLWPREGLAVAWGAPKCGKSFWATDAAMHVALGWEYRSRRVQQAPVVYVAGEGQHGFKKRIEAFRQQNMQLDYDPPPFFLLGEPVDLIGDHQTLIADIRAQVGDRLPGLVVLDTLNRTLRGSENDPEDMGRYVAAADAIRSAFACCVVVIHHCGTDGNRPRGHTSLTGAADAQFSVTKSPAGTVTVTSEFVKDGPEGETLSFTLRQVEVGIDDDGDDITSCVVEPTEPETIEPAIKRPTGNTGTMLTILEEAGPAGLTVEEWNEQARQAGIGAARQRLYEIRVTLKRKKLVYESQDGRWHVMSR